MKQITLKHIAKPDKNGIVTTINYQKYKYKDFTGIMDELINLINNDPKYNKNDVPLYLGTSKLQIGGCISIDKNTYDMTFELFDDFNLDKDKEYAYGIVSIVDSDTYEVYRIKGFQLIELGN